MIRDDFQNLSMETKLSLIEKHPHLITEFYNISYEMVKVAISKNLSSLETLPQTAIDLIPESDFLLIFEKHTDINSFFILVNTFSNNNFSSFLSKTFLHEYWGLIKKGINRKVKKELLHKIYSNLNENDRIECIKNKLYFGKQVIHLMSFKELNEAIEFNFQYHELIKLSNLSSEEKFILYYKAVTIAKEKNLNNLSSENFPIIEKTPYSYEIIEKVIAKKEIIDLINKPF